MKDNIKKECTKLELKDSDYTYIDVEIELDGTAEKEASFGTILQELGFEEEAAEGDEAAGDDAAADDAAADDAPADDAPADDAGRRNMQDEGADPPADDTAADDASDETTEDDAAAEGEEAAVDLAKLAKAPYALVMRNQQGFRVSGNNISTELCYQAKQFKKLAEKKEKSK